MKGMKDSGIAWIGAIPNHWKVSKIKQVIRWKSVKGQPDLPVLSLYRDYGVIPKGSRDDNHNVTSLDTSAYKVVECGNLVINKMKAWQGSLAVSEYNGIVSPAYHICQITSKNICKKYLHYLLRDASYLPEYMRLSTGLRVGQWDLSFDDFKNIPFLLPPLAEQERIAAFLDAECAEIDAVLEKTRASIEEYKKLKQAVITQAVTKGVRGDRPMKNSGIEWIGDIPAEWKVNLIKNVATTGSGGTPKSGNPSLYDGDINWICSYDLKERPITKSERRLTQLGADSIAGNVQLKGSVLVAMYGGSGTIGNSGILECEAKTNQAICSIKFNNGYITDYFGFYYILSIRKYWMIFAVGTRKDPNISQDIVRKMPCILPPIAEQEEIVAYCNKTCDQLDTLITKKQQYLTEIENYKKSLIYEYVTGKKEVV